MAEIEDRIAKLLALAFRTESPDEALNALAQAKRTLAKSGRDIHDVLSAPKLYGGLAEWVAEMAARKQAKEERQKAEMEAKRWARKRGVDPWLTDDDPLWAEWADAVSALIISSFWARPICAGSCDPMRAIKMKPARAAL